MKPPESLTHTEPHPVACSVRAPSPVSSMTGTLDGLLLLALPMDPYLASLALCTGSLWPTSNRDLFIGVAPNHEQIDRLSLSLSQKYFSHLCIVFTPLL